MEISNHRKGMGKKMEQKQTFIEQAKLTEEGLEAVAGGGGGVTGGCWFKYKEGSQTRTKNGRTEAECDSNCFGFVPCGCHGSAHCVDRWHEVTPNGSPLPRDYKDHRKWY